MLCVTGEAETVSQFRLFQATGILHPGWAWVRYHVTLKWGSGGRTGSGQVEAGGGAGGEEGNIADHYIGVCYTRYHSDHGKQR